MRDIAAIASTFPVYNITCSPLKCCIQHLKTTRIISSSSKAQYNTTTYPPVILFLTHPSFLGRSFFNIRTYSAFILHKLYLVTIRLLNKTYANGTLQ
ncbi:hypothetical protein KSU1_D0570 [Candidatus Jettenia caeni]|uniref:Uncharacterized protein n=1 Tax=Candidatus Jettenia caeni TaxID=247490 RepID=I3IQ84_9BACT|nr:hypothetical protein KSU1_D0570 [Candidatus Jettenia caeni]